MSERTLVLVKPDGVRRGLIGECLARFERKGLAIAELELRHVDKALAEAHYAEHRDKPFYGDLVEFITSGPVAAAIVEGDNAITAARSVMGATNPLEASPGTIRGDYATSIGQNIVHGSDAPETATREIELFFPGR